MQNTMNRALRGALTGLTAASILASAGCHDLLTVSNPQVFSNADANSPLLLPAVAAGAEGSFQLAVPGAAAMSGMLSDELQQTSTWIDYADISTGRIAANWATTGESGFMDALLRARSTADLASKRFESVMGDSAHTSPLFVTSQISKFWADIQIAMGYCEAPYGQNTPAVHDTAIFKLASDSLTALIALIQAAHYAPTDTSKQARLDLANAGIARANLMIGNYATALAAAQAVSPTFKYNAIFSTNSGSQYDYYGTQANTIQNRSVTVRSVWWQYIDTIAGAMRDPYTNQLDPRLPFGHDNNNSHGYNLGADGLTKFYSLTKFPALNSPVPISNAAEMQLIIAEVNWHNGNYQTAVNMLNTGRAAVGLAPLTLPTSGDVPTQVRDMILQERFATLFGQGTRLEDLYRFGLITAKLGSGRALKLPLSFNEENNNPNIGFGQGTCPGRS